MVLFRCILLATAPAVFWMWLYYRRDRWEPEPKLLVLKLFGYGVLMAIPVWYLQPFLPGPEDRLYDNFVRVAFLEEFFKLLPLVWFAHRRREFNEPMDGIVYAVAAALGFATVENVIYAMVLGPKLLLARAFTSTLAHVGFSGLIGYAFGAARFRAKGERRGLVRSFLAVVALHGAYDLMLTSGAQPGVPDWVPRVTIVVMIPTLLGLLFWASHLADRASPFRPPEKEPAAAR